MEKTAQSAAAGDALLTLQATHIRRERLMNLASALMLLHMEAQRDHGKAINQLPNGGIQ